MVLGPAARLDLVILDQAVLAVSGISVPGVPVVLGTLVQAAVADLVTTVPAEAAVTLVILQVVLAAMEMKSTMILKLGAGLFDLVKW